MICEHLIRFVLSEDPLEIAKSRVQTREVAKIIAEKRARVHSALASGARSIPSRGVSA